MVDIIIRLQILYPGITFGAREQEADCVISNGEIIYWARSEPRPSREELEAIPQVDIDGGRATSRCAELEKLVISTANEKVSWHIVEPDLTSYMAKSDSLNRKAVKYLLDPISNAPLTQEEDELIEYLDVIQGLAWAIRVAQGKIIGELCLMTTEQINILADDWVINHQLWP